MSAEHYSDSDEGEYWLDKAAEAEALDEQHRGGEVIEGEVKGVDYDDTIPF
jgi:hypothetical protein